MKIDHKDYINLLRELRKIPKVKKYLYVRESDLIMPSPIKTILLSGNYVNTM